MYGMFATTASISGDPQKNMTGELTFGIFIQRRIKVHADASREY